MSVRRIVTQDERDVDGVLDLYGKLFPDDGTNYSQEEIMEFLDGTSDFSLGRHVRAENIFLAAKNKGFVVGILLCAFYPDRRKAIIAYYGIDKSVPAARASAAFILLKKLKRILLDGSRGCDYLFFDLQGFEPTTPKDETSERKARPIRFRQSAKMLGLTARQLKFSYLCPKISLTEENREYPFNLMCVPVDAHLPNPAPKSLIMDFLRFIFHDCYGDLYPVTDERFKPFHDHLEHQLKRYEDTLPELIESE